MGFDPLRALGPIGLPARAGIELGRYVARKLSPEPETRPQQQPQQRPATPRTPARHPANPNSANFNVQPLNAQATQLYNAILAYPDTKANPAQARQIAREVDSASRAFGVDAKVMLSILAHESGGFDVNAESHTGAKGLGQLTGTAIQEMRRLSYDPTYDASYRGNSEIQHYPDAEVQALVERPNTQAIFQRLGAREENRYNVRDNIWGSTFYARIAMDRANENRSGAAIVLGADGMMGRYNGASSSERAAHSAGIADAYRRMFNQPIPSTLRPTV